MTDTTNKPGLPTVEQVAAWNERHPVGTLVHYHAVIGGPITETRRTREPAIAMPGLFKDGIGVVYLERKAGWVALDALTIAEEQHDGRND